MANIIKLGSLFLDGRPVETGMQYVPSQTIEVGEMTPSKEIGWVAVNGLLIADQYLLTNVSWDDLDVQGLVFGKEVTVQGLRFKIRLLKVGSKEDVPNEWDAALDAVGEDDTLWHWDHKFFWGQEPVSGSGVVLCEPWVLFRPHLVLGWIRASPLRCRFPPRFGSTQH